MFIFSSCHGYYELNIPDMEPIGSWTLEGICREVDSTERERERETYGRDSLEVRRLGMLRPAGAEGAEWVEEREGGSVYLSVLRGRQREKNEKARV